MGCVACKVFLLGVDIAFRIFFEDSFAFLGLVFGCTLRMGRVTMQLPAGEQGGSGAAAVTPSLAAR